MVGYLVEYLDSLRVGRMADMSVGHWDAVRVGEKAA